MCEIIAFPNKKIITKEIEERLFALGTEYVDIVNDVLASLDEDEYDNLDINEFSVMVAAIFQKGIEIAIDELDYDWDSD